MGMQDGAVSLLNMLKQKLQQAPADQAILLTRMCGHYLNLTAIAEQHYMFVSSWRSLPCLRCISPANLSSVQ
jgi:hypothetical protein